jgi:hypothetical protein
VGTKVALTLALTVPLESRSPPEYWALARFPGLEPAAGTIGAAADLSAAPARTASSTPDVAHGDLTALQANQ